jgi:CMP-N,N'-diacetyllegionaminic acid synthase
MKTYVFDLDNTLCSTKQTEDGHWDYKNSIAIVDRINTVNKLYDDGNQIIIETARGSKSKKDWYEFTYNQLNSFGIKFHQLRSGIKFSADYFIDDKGINSEDFFSGFIKE